MGPKLARTFLDKANERRVLLAVLAGSGAAYHLFSIERAGERLAIKGRARGVDNTSGELVDLGALDL